MILAAWLVLCCRQVVEWTGWLLPVPAVASAIDRSNSSQPVLLWQVPVEGRGTPAVQGSTVYFLSKHHELIAVDARSGRVKWRRTTAVSDGTTAGSVVKTTPVAVIAGDYDVVAFGHDGAPLWRFVPAYGYGPGLYLGDVSDRTVVAGSPSGHVYAIDVITGHERWSTRIAQDNETTAFAPVIAGDLVIAGYTSFTAPSSGGVVACELANGRERWRRRLPAPADPTIGSGVAGGPVDAGDVLLVTNRDGVIYALDRMSGSVQWSLPSVAFGRENAGAAGQQDFRALVRNGGEIVAGSLTGTVVAYEIATGREVWRRTPIEASVAFGIASHRDVVYVPYFTGQLVALDSATGVERWRTAGAARGLSWTPLPIGDRLYAVGSAAGLLTFRP